MANQETQSQPAEGFLAGEIGQQLKAVFEPMPHRVPLYLFTRKADNEALNQAARTLIQAFRRTFRQDRVQGVRSQP